METDETLKQQFKLLQEQQQQKLLRRKQMREEKENSTNNAANKTFGIDDNLDLKVDNKTGTTYLSEELVDHLNNQIRELRDENSRCYKLLSERDFEIKQLKKKKTEEKNSLSGMQVTNETAATKIVELSKKVRELTSELESEKTRCKQMSKKCHDLQTQLSSVPETGRSSLSSAVSQRSVYYTDEEKEQTEVDIKTLQEKLRQTELKVADFRNQSVQLKQDLKLAHKVLSQEVGENVNISSLLSGSTNWRGRAQQIIVLQSKVEELKNQVANSPSKARDEDDLEREFMGRSMSSKKRNQDEKYREELKKYEKEKKEAQEKMANELKLLENEHSNLKSKLEASKARNKVLTNEVKSMKQQMSTLIEKGKNDDELIQALMKQQSQLKEMLDQTNTQQLQNNLSQQDRMKELSVKSQQDTNIVEQLKTIVAEKEIVVQRLEEEINELKIQHLQKLQDGEITTLTGNYVQERPVLIGPIPQKPVPPTNENTFIKSVTPPASRQSNRSHSARSQTRSVRPSSSSSEINNNQIIEVQHQCHEYKILLQTSNVERERLTELVQVLQKRIEESTSQFSQCQNELITQRRNNALLEKQLAQSKSEISKMSKGNMSSRKKPSSNQSSARVTCDLNYSTNEDEAFSSIEELQTCLEIQKDENQALKSALQSTLQAKDEDLKLYSQTIEETKAVFLQALRQYKQNMQQGT